MMRWEFVIVLAWLLVPPLVFAGVALVFLGRKRTRHSACQSVVAVAILVVVSVALASAFVAWGPVGSGSSLGVRDEPVMWAPFAFIAVALAFPIAAWWALRR